jgi:hypothetical protein
MERAADDVERRERMAAYEPPPATTPSAMPEDPPHP